MEEEHPALQAGRQLHRAAGVVAGLVLGRRAHHALGVDGVVLAPVRGRCAGHRHLDELRIPQHRHERHVAAVAVAHDGHARRVHVRALVELAHQLRLVVDVGAAELQVGGRLERLAAPGRAAVVDLGDEDAQARLRLLRAEARRDRGDERTAVGVDHQRIPARRIEPRGLVEDAVELGLAVGRHEAKELGRGHALLGVRIGCGRGELRDFLAVHAVERGGGRHVHELLGGHEMLVVRRHLERGVMKVFLREAFATRAVEPRTVELRVDGGLARARRVVEPAGRLVDGDDRLRHPRIVGDPGKLARGKVPQLEVGEAARLRLPEEARAVGEEAHLRRVLLPRGLLLGDHRARAPGGRIGGHQLHGVLAAVGAEPEECIALRRPLAAVDVLVLCGADVNGRALARG